MYHHFRHHWDFAKDAGFLGLSSDAWTAITAIATFLAVLVALVTPWIVESLRRNRKSNLIFKDLKTTHQEEDVEKFEPIKLLDVSRLIIENIGKHTAFRAEAYLDKIICDGELRKEFIPMPLIWTHAHLTGTSTIRDIYPNQTVFLDIFDHLFDHNYVGESSVLFCIPSGRQYEELSKLNIGKSELHIKIYQESGQVFEQILVAEWNGKNVPKLSIKR